MNNSLIPKQFLKFRVSTFNLLVNAESLSSLSYLHFYFSRLSLYSADTAIVIVSYLYNILYLSQCVLVCATVTELFYCTCTYKYVWHSPEIAKYAGNDHGDSRRTYYIY